MLKLGIFTSKIEDPLCLSWTGEASRYKFYLIMREHLFVFRKPQPGEDLGRIRYSLWRPAVQS
ncbi:MAG: hypothetical protein BroJett011_26580 [Chloroflexota bacterium]|nr:MAG: hypothetical protein BroJett011_26580 [Chloroflexota bacterium]